KEAERPVRRQPASAPRAAEGRGGSGGNARQDAEHPPDRDGCGGGGRKRSDLSDASPHRHHARPKAAGGLGGMRGRTPSTPQIDYARLQPRVLAQILGLVGALPRELGLVAAEVSERRRLAVDRALEI